MPSWIVAVIQLGYASDWTGHPEKDNPHSAFKFSVFELFRFFVFGFKFPCPVKCEANYFTGDCPVKCAPWSVKSFSLWNLLFIPAGGFVTSSDYFTGQLLFCCLQFFDSTDVDSVFT